MDQDFTSQFIQGIESAQRIRKNKRQEAYEIEDRDIQKELLQHRLRELKLQDKLRARAAAVQNLEMQSGMAQNQVPGSMLEELTPQQLEGDKSPGMVATLPNGIPGMVPPIKPAERQMRPVQIPGIEEMGVPGFERRPQTMEQILAELGARKQAEESGKVYNVARGGMLATGSGETVARNPYEAAPTYREVSIRQPDGSVVKKVVTAAEAANMGEVIDAPPVDNTLVPVTTRDASGRKTTTYTPRPQAKGVTAVEEPEPVRPSTARDPVAESAQLALQALDELDAMLNKGVENPKPAGGGIMGLLGMGSPAAEPDQSQQQYSDALAEAQRLLASHYNAAGLDGEAAESAAAANLGVPRQVKVGSEIKTVGNEWTSARRKVAIPNIRKRLQDAVKKAGGAARAVGSNGSGVAVIRDGVLYIDGVAIGDPK